MNVSSLLRTSRMSRWSPSISQIYERCPNTKEWGVKGQISSRCNISKMSFLRLDEKTYGLPLLRNAEVKYLTVNRWREYSADSNEENINYVTEPVTLPYNSANKQSLHVQGIAQNNIAQMPVTVFRQYCSFKPSECVNLYNIGRVAAPTYASGLDLYFGRRIVHKNSILIGGFIISYNRPIEWNSSNERNVLNKIPVRGVYWTRSGTPKIVNPFFPDTKILQKTFKNTYKTIK